MTPALFVLAAARAVPPWRSPVALVGLLLVAAARLLSAPQTVWELDEVLFVRGVERFAPLEHRPHPPGYPLTVGLGKVLAAALGDPFAGLVALSIVGSLVGYLALVDAFARLAAPAGGAPDQAARRVGVGGALLFHLSPSMLLHGPLALSDAPALAFLALALAAAARLSVPPPGRTPAGGDARQLPALVLGGAAGAAVGCRPQLAVAVLPMLGLVLARRGSPRRAAAALGAFAAVCLGWLLPLLTATGGPGGLLGLLRRQAALVASQDAEAARAGLAAMRLVIRFVAHPWGPKALAVPLLLLAVIGAWVAWRERRSILPLLVLAGVDLAFCLLVMDPGDAVRYALPSLLAVAFLAAFGCSALARALGVAQAAPVAVVALLAGFVAFTLPLLRIRATTPSPPVQAARWARDHLPQRALVLVDPPLAPHASQLLPQHPLAPADPGLSHLAGAGPRPVYLFADGESSWPDAATFRWPPTAAWGKLTRGLYRVVSLSPLPASQRCGAVRGVYGYEPAPPRARWRWLADDAALAVEAKEPARLALELGLPAPAPWPEVTVAVAVAGRPAGELRVPRGGRRRAELELPTGGTVEVSLRSDRRFVPAAAGISDSDTRQLAVQLLRCELRPVGSGGWS